MKTYQHFIDGKYVDPQGGEWMDSLDPYTGKPWARVPRGCAKDADAAVAAAELAPFEGPIAGGRAIRNRLENAVDYGVPAEAMIIDRGDDAVEIAIRDRGPGIPPAEQERVFEPFYRLDRARSGDHGGAGLGLSIARNIARAHGGDVTVANGETGGLIVTMRLPRPRDDR